MEAYKAFKNKKANEEELDIQPLFFVLPIEDFNAEQLKTKPMNELYNGLNLAIRDYNNYELQIQFQYANADKKVRDKNKSETQIKQIINADRCYNILCKNLNELDYRKRCYETMIKVKETKDARFNLYNYLYRFGT